MGAVYDKVLDSGKTIILLTFLYIIRIMIEALDFNVFVDDW